jgi:hypothetical protein
MIFRRVTALFALLAISSPLAADPEGPDGVLRSYACGKMETPLRFDIALQDDGPSYARVGRTLAAELERKRAQLSATAPLRLSLSMDTVRAVARNRRPDLGRFSHDTDRGTQVQLNLWSNQHDSVLGGRRDDAVGRSIDELRVEIAISDKSNGRCVWQGEAAVDLDGRDPDRVALTIIPLLVAHIGETVRAEPITLD